MCLTKAGDAPRGPRDRGKDCVYPPALFDHPPLNTPKLKRMTPRPIMITVQSSPNRIRTATCDGRQAPMDQEVSLTANMQVTRHGYNRTPMGGYFRPPQLTLKPCTANSLLRVLADKGQAPKRPLP